MEQMLSLAGGMWTHIGPGLLFAMALPVLLVALLLVGWTGYRRIGAVRSGKAS